jgi:hypothetical protein
MTNVVQLPTTQIDEITGLRVFVDTSDQKEFHLVDQYGKSVVLADSVEGVEARAMDILRRLGYHVVQL